MIMVGKVIISLVWAFWMMAMSTAEGLQIEDDQLEYNPTYR